MLLNPSTHCSEAADEARAEEATTTESPDANPIANMISIQMYIADAGLHFSRNLTEEFLRFWGCRGLEYPVSHTAQRHAFEWTGSPSKERMSYRFPVDLCSVISGPVNSSEVHLTLGCL